MIRTTISSLALTLAIISAVVVANPSLGYLEQSTGMGDNIVRAIGFVLVIVFILFVGFRNWASRNKEQWKNHKKPNFK